jgi:hypothetical protein
MYFTQGVKGILPSAVCLAAGTGGIRVLPANITECDQQLEKYLARLEDRTQGATLPKETRKGRLNKKKKRNPQFNLQEELFRMTGTDLTQIDGIDVVVAMTVVSEVGWDMSKWKTENHFVSWLKLAPDNKISGGKVIGKGRTPSNNRATTVLTTFRRKNDAGEGRNQRRRRRGLKPECSVLRDWYSSKQ